MDIAKPMGTANPYAGVAGKAAAKTTAENTMSIGAKLNQMAGIATEDPALKPKGEMGKDAFMKMFMEQLKNQDPLNPAKSDQFNQQMAMFSQLEQQVNMNKNLEKMLAQSNNTQVAALQLVGKDITADRGALYHEQNKFTAMNFKLPQDVTGLEIKITDQQGETVRTFKLDSRPAGDMSWKWDGKTDQEMLAPSGKYSYSVKGTAGDGKEVSINNKVDGRVTGVTSSQGIVYLMVGEQKVALNDVEMIKEAGTNQAPTNPANATPTSFVPPNANGSALASAKAAALPTAMMMPSKAQPASASQNAQAASSRSSGGSTAGDKNWSLSHDSFDELPAGSDKETAGTESVSNNGTRPSIRDVEQDDGGLPSVMPLFTR